MHVDHLGAVLRGAGDGDVLGLVAVLVPALPERLGAVVGQTNDHCLPTGRLELR